MINFKKFLNLNMKNVNESFFSSLNDKDFLFSLEYYIKNTKSYNKELTNLLIERYSSINFKELEFKNSFGSFLIKHNNKDGFLTILDLCFTGNIDSEEVVSLSLSFLSESLKLDSKEYTDIIFKRIKSSFHLFEILESIPFVENNLYSIKMILMLLKDIDEKNVEDYKLSLKENFFTIANPYKNNFQIIDSLLNLIKDYHEEMIIGRDRRLYKQCQVFIRDEKRRNFIKECA